MTQPDGLLALDETGHSAWRFESYDVATVFGVGDRVLAGGERLRCLNASDGVEIGSRELDSAPALVWNATEDRVLVCYEKGPDTAPKTVVGSFTTPGFTPLWDLEIAGVVRGSLGSGYFHQVEADPPHGVTLHSAATGGVVVRIPTSTPHPEGPLGESVTQVATIGVVGPLWLVHDVEGLRAVEVTTGSVRWAAEVNYGNTELVVGASVLLEVAPGTVRAREVATGKPLWEIRDMPPYTPTTFLDESHCVISAAKQARLLDARSGCDICRPVRVPHPVDKLVPSKTDGVFALMCARGWSVALLA